MRIKFLKKDGEFLKGVEYEVSAAEAKKFVEDHRVAEYLYRSKLEQKRIETMSHSPRSRRIRKPKPEVESREED